MGGAPLFPHLDASTRLSNPQTAPTCGHKRSLSPQAGEAGVVTKRLRTDPFDPELAIKVNLGVPASEDLVGFDRHQGSAPACETCQKADERQELLDDLKDVSQEDADPVCAAEATSSSELGPSRPTELLISTMDDLSKPRFFPGEQFRVDLSMKAWNLLKAHAVDDICVVQHVSGQCECFLSSRKLTRVMSVKLGNKMRRLSPQRNILTIHTQGPGMSVVRFVCRKELPSGFCLRESVGNGACTLGLFPVEDPRKPSSDSSNAVILVTECPDTALCLPFDILETVFKSVLHDALAFDGLSKMETRPKGDASLLRLVCRLWNAAAAPYWLKSRASQQLNLENSFTAFHRIPSRFPLILFPSWRLITELDLDFRRAKTCTSHPGCPERWKNPWSLWLSLFQACPNARHLTLDGPPPPLHLRSAVSTSLALLSNLETLKVTSRTPGQRAMRWGSQDFELLLHPYSKVFNFRLVRLELSHDILVPLNWSAQKKEFPPPEPLSKKSFPWVALDNCAMCSRTLYTIISMSLVSPCVRDNGAILCVRRSLGPGRLHPQEVLATLVECFPRSSPCTIGKLEMVLEPWSAASLDALLSYRSPLLNDSLALLPLEMLVIEGLTSESGLISGELFQNYKLASLKDLHLAYCSEVGASDVWEGIQKGNLPALRYLSVKPFFNDEEWESTWYQFRFRNIFDDAEGTRFRLLESGQEEAYDWERGAGEQEGEDEP